MTCTLCPRACGVNRTSAKGFCGAGERPAIACGFLAADRPDMAYRIACGMRESARHMPIVLESDSFFADAIWIACFARTTKLTTR